MPVGIDGAGTYTIIRVADADTATGWSVIKHEGSGGTPSLLASVGTIDLVAEGTDARAARTNRQRVEIRYTDSTSYDFTSGSTGAGTVKIPSGLALIWSLFLAAGSLLTKANGGMQIVLGDGTGLSCFNVAGSGGDYTGGFFKWAIATQFAEDENIGGSADMGNITTFGFITDVGTATTRFDNFVVDAVDVGDGLTFNGTTDTDKLFAEALTVNKATSIGVLDSRAGKIFAQGNLEFSGTAQTSDSESLTFTNTVGGAYTYNLDITGGVTFTNTTVDAEDGVDYNFDSSGATSFVMNGGGLSGFATLTTGSGQTISGAVFQKGGTGTINNNIELSTFNQCGKQTIVGSLADSIVNKSTATEATSGASTSVVAGTRFVKDTGTSHAFELTGGAGAYTWSGLLTGYDAGVTGNGVQVTGGSITGNEAIHIPATTGTFDITVADGASVPSVSTGGAIVNVVANQIILTFTGWVSGGIFIIYDEDSADPQELGTELQRNNNTTADQTFTYSAGKVGDDIAVVFIKNGYKIYQETITLGATSTTFDLKLEQETN